VVVLAVVEETEVMLMAGFPLARRGTFRGTAPVLEVSRRHVRE